MAPEKGMPSYGNRYSIEYPLREWGLNRAMLSDIIRRVGLPVPPKSACFFCPSMKMLEIQQLKRESPDMYAMAIEMERMYRDGRHYRGDNVWTVRGIHKITQEKIEEEVTAKDAAAARAMVRGVLKDTASPFQWRLSPSEAVPGLGRSFAWSKAEERETQAGPLLTA